MSDTGVPNVTFPVAFEQIPEEVKRLTTFIESKRSEIEIARTILEMVRRGCSHADAKRGYNERDGSWMAPCLHCGDSR